MTGRLSSVVHTVQMIFRLASNMADGLNRRFNASPNDSTYRGPPNVFNYDGQ